MARYIDADELSEMAMREAIRDRADLLKLIASEPTADVTEIKHGHWVKTSNKNFSFMCSNCKTTFNTIECPYYCSCCGAKMDEEVE